MTFQRPPARGETSTCSATKVSTTWLICHSFSPTGVMADVRVSWLDPCKIRRYTIVGSEKMLVYDDTASDDKIVLYDKGVDMPPYSDTEEEFHLSYRQGDGVTFIPSNGKSRCAKSASIWWIAFSRHKEPRSSGRVGLKVVQRPGSGAKVIAQWRAKGADLSGQTIVLRIAPDVRLGREVRVYSLCQPLWLRDRR